MDVSEIRELNDEALVDALEDQREAMFNLRFQKAFGQLEDQNAIRLTRRTIARILTVMHERNLNTQGRKG
ncbi:MAG: 50S ribosomal protein L29 [Anaerolineae bacterium]|uniref:50S ribosomal protein L29 n=1 Tax=Candidatus Flexifilum breve TaxID=3140694 RepID=UPI001ACB83A5|nr:50S ribosomal protein L29 [Chloroflexota bacterium]MBK9748606.1 50S ribosomal protein L29 [Chloroflexota bacterium]MBN8634455.1 50S ribosomal protein L29 [Anaerolineae bacterium]